MSREDPKRGDQEFDAELSRSNQPGYRSRYDDEFGFEDMDPGDADYVDPGTAASGGGPRRPKFMDLEEQETVDAGEEEDDDNFGAGVF